MSGHSENMKSKGSVKNRIFFDGDIWQTDLHLQVGELLRIDNQKYKVSSVEVFASIDGPSMKPLYREARLKRVV